jgi:hypothetical protein
LEILNPSGSSFMADTTKFFNPTRKQTLDSKLARYALAGSALLGVPAVAQADIIYTPGPVTAGPSQTIPINFNPLSDATTDFSISAGSAGIPSFISINGAVNTRFTTGLTPLNLGDAITLANTTVSGGNLMKSHIGPTYDYPWGGVANGTSRFLGVKFDIAGQSHLGWAEISLQKNIPSATVLGYAYETVAGQQIAAGATTPEPSSLALFAAGAAGILALRRRRAA